VSAKEDLYAQALAAFQEAIELDRAYALHDMSKDKGYYPIKKMLGAGGMGCAFLCQNHNFKIKGHQWVVVKCFWENISDSLEQLFTEPKTMHDIAGDYVPKILGYGYADNVHQTKPYFVSEYIEGAIDGEAWLEKMGCLDLTTGLQVAVQIAKALQRAHEKGICHLDLKPANLLLRKMDEKVSVKVIDFGLARVTTALSERAESRTGATVFGQAILGTLDYAPPEQRGYAYRYGQPSTKSDVFAFGMTMYRLWTGKNPHPFRERDLPDHSALRDLLCDCVAENPEERPESAQLVKCLATIIDEEAAKHQPKNKQSEQAFQQMYQAAQGQKDTFIDKTETKRKLENKQAEQQMYQAAQGQKDTFVDALKEVNNDHVDNQASHKAYQEDTIEAYQADNQAWLKASQEDTIEAYQAYLDGKTLKRYAKEAGKKKKEKTEEITGCLGLGFVILVLTGGLLYRYFF